MKKYWYPIALQKEIKKDPKSFFLLGEKIVVYRGSHGLVAQKDSCPHRKYPLSEGKVVDGEIQCGYHGWKFDNKGFQSDLPGSGKQLNSKCSILQTYSIHEHEHLIWICLQENVPFTPFHKDLLPRKIFSHKTTIPGDPKDILENFLDPLHTSFLHNGIIRSQKKRNKTIAEIRSIKNGVEVKYTEVSPQTGIIGSIMGRFITHSYGRLTKPNVIDLEFHSKKGIVMTNRFIIVPTHKNENFFFSQLTFRKTWIPSQLKMGILAPLFYLALQQDKKALKIQLMNMVPEEHKEYNSTYLDIMRPYIDQMQMDKELKVVEKDINLFL
ncbi:aromatic ring-hydroxylating dioxygenase subunit alpha [Aquimarina addita]|uniref:Aromatic ring-hydroxylating dioxygenase subunit alpha n=1 Tax=Aquimarina addita TaxID=870485 RepID=A0ABP6UQJ4_9FLAO